MSATLHLTSITGMALPQGPFPPEYAYLEWEEPPRLAGAADVPLYFDSPTRGSAPVFLREFRRWVMTARGLMPGVAERDITEFIRGAREASALMGLHRAAESFAMGPTPPGPRRAGRARWLRMMADRYLESADQRPVPIAE